jgi:N-acetyl-alpha-D-muramate 1-phosphate uridylyltransferase
MSELCAVVLAAGEGTRLRPLTRLLPKALCPVGNVPLLDRALARVGELGLAGPARVAVNASWLAEQVATHVGRRAQLSHEQSPLGTAGGVGRLRDWIDGRPVLVGNADAYLAGGTIDRLLAGWDGETVRLLGVPGEPGDFSGYDFAGFSLLPWCWVRDLREDSGELVGAVWRPAEAACAVEVVAFTGYFRDTGTPAGYLAANLHAAGGGNLIAPDAEVTGECRQAVVGAGAVVRGSVTRGVVWSGGQVGAAEYLTDAVRAGTDLTVRAL